jgi:hypothetical protein
MQRVALFSLIYVLFWGEYASDFIYRTPFETKQECFDAFRATVGAGFKSYGCKRYVKEKS